MISDTEAYSSCKSQVLQESEGTKIILLLEIACPELGPGTVVSDQPAFNLRSQGRKTQPFSSHGHAAGQPGF